MNASGNKPFWNLAAAVETELDSRELRNRLRLLEDSLGRVRDGQNKFSPRTIDIDILPQLQFQNQPFIMIPLAEIAPSEVDRESGLTFKKLAEKFEVEKKSYKKII